MSVVHLLKFHMLGHRENLDKFKMIAILQVILFDKEIGSKLITENIIITSNLMFEDLGIIFQITLESKMK